MKVTVITVNLNGNRFLRGAISSVLLQQSVDLEYLIIDGGSTDGSLETIAEAAAGDARIRWVSEKDSGISDAMNKGVALSSGEIIGFLHADDFYHRNDILSTVTGLMEDHPEALWCTGGLREVGKGDRVLREHDVRRFSRRRLLRNNIIFHPATFVRRKFLLEAGGFDESLQYTMDYDLWLRISAAASPVEVNCHLASFRVHAGSISSKNRLAALDEEYQVRMRYLNGAVASCAHALYQFLRRAYETCRPARI